MNGVVVASFDESFSPFFFLSSFEDRYAFIFCGVASKITLAPRANLTLKRRSGQECTDHHLPNMDHNFPTTFVRLEKKLKKKKNETSFLVLQIRLRNAGSLRAPFPFSLKDDAGLDLLSIAKLNPVKYDQRKLSFASQVLQRPLLLTCKSSRWIYHHVGFTLQIFQSKQLRAKKRFKRIFSQGNLSLSG